ncbi:DUF3320 domain-containing protein [Anaerovoracaceae bacterium HCP3S3_H6]
MAKECSICGKKLGFLSGKVAVSDGIVCDSCWFAAGLDLSINSMMTSNTRTVNQLRDMIEIEVLKRAAELTGRTDLAAAVPQAAVPAEKTPAVKTTPARKVETTDAKPVDIILEVGKDRKVNFQCAGQPVINLEDLIQGNEMIIGDGFIYNRSKETLPDVRIACEFQPAIVDPGLLYYEEGTFTAGVEGKFEIDDPPVNLEEYAKIKRTRNGKIRFTLFMGEQEVGTAECSMRVKPAPEEEMQKYMKSVMYETEKNASGPVNVFLYARADGTFDEDLMRRPDLLYAMYANGQEQLIGDVYVANETGKKLKNIQFRADFTSDILEPVDVFLGDVPAGENIVFEVDDPAINLRKLEQITEIETCTATYTLTVNGKKVSEACGRVTICPYDQWNGALVLLPAYMTPNHPDIIGLLQQAARWMQKEGMNPSLEGYQGDAKRVEEMTMGVYNAIKEAGIIYSNPPASFFGPQRVRLGETVMQQKFATCMDITVLFASCLESFGLHPVLITAPAHIFAGVWLTSKGRCNEPVLSDTAQLRKLIKEKELVALECTAMTLGKNLSYKEAKKEAEEILKALDENKIPDNDCIDVQLVRNIGIRPIPMRRNPAGVIAEPSVEAPAIASGEAPAENVSAEAIEAATVTTAAAAASAEPLRYIREEYRVFEKDLSQITIDNFYDRQTKKLIKEAISEIVQVEGPISQPALIRTLINSTGLGRAGKNISEHLDKLVATADVKITRQSGVRFLWNHGSNPADYHTFRFQEQRNTEDICKYELKNAVCCLLQENGPMTKEEITKAMVSLLGYSRSSHRIEECAADAIKAARELKAIEQNERKQFVVR